MDIEKQLNKLLLKIYKKNKEKPIEYEIDDAFEIISNDKYNSKDLLIWVDNEEFEKPIFFNNKEEALEYLYEELPEKVFIEFSEDFMIKETSKDFLYSINCSKKLTNEVKIEIVKILLDGYIESNKKFMTKELENIINYINSLSDIQIYEKVKNDIELFSELTTNYVNTIVCDECTLYVEPNENFYNTKNIRLINEVYKELLINFHNYNFESGCNNEESIDLIHGFLHHQFSLNPKYYKYYFGQEITDETMLINILTLMVISDYYKFTYYKKNENNFLDNKDKEYLKLIQNSTKEEIIDEFDDNLDFSKNIIGDFLFYNELYENHPIEKTSDIKTLKKIDPFYWINKN